MKKDIRCVGCHNEYTYMHECLISLNKTLIGKCPCVNCIVKAMCSYMCDTRVRFFADQSKKTIDELSNIRISNNKQALTDHLKENIDE